MDARSTDETGTSRPPFLTRRQALKTGAAVAGTALWVAPAIQAMTITSASADRPSGAGNQSPGGRGRGKASTNPGHG